MNCKSNPVLLAALTVVIGWCHFLTATATEAQHLNFRASFTDAFEAADPLRVYKWNLTNFGVKFRHSQPGLEGGYSELYEPYIEKREQIIRYYSDQPEERATRLERLRTDELEQFVSRLSPDQRELFDNMLVQTYLNATITVNGRLRVVPHRLLVPGLIHYVKMSEEQVDQVRKAIALHEARSQESEANYAARAESIDVRWQQTLKNNLTPTQLLDYESALDTPHPALVQRIQRLGGTRRGPYPTGSGVTVASRIRATSLSPPESNSTSHSSTNHVTEVSMLRMTPAFLDALLQPHGLLGLLLDEEFGSGLAISEDQKQQLHVLRDQWLAESPLPEVLTIENREEDRRNRRTKKQRESAIAPIEYRGIQNQIDAVLREEQAIRLRQIWNQNLMSNYWEGVALSFPDWRSYLELTAEQNAIFDQIHAEFITELDNAEKQLFREKENLYEEQRQTLMDIFTHEQRVLMHRTFRIPLLN